jgi:hypothetical protein
VLTILINLSADEEVLDNLVSDDAFLETLLLKVTVSTGHHLLPSETLPTGHHNILTS